MKALRTYIITSLLFCFSAVAQDYPPPRLAEEGSVLGPYYLLDCVSDNLTCANSSGQASITFDDSPSFDYIGIGNSAPTSTAGVYFSGASSTMAAPFYSILTYTGSDLTGAAVYSRVAYQGSTANSVFWGIKGESYATSSSSGIFYNIGLQGTAGFNSGTDVIGVGEYAVLIGAQADLVGAGGTHSAAGGIIAIGMYVPTFPTFTGMGLLAEHGALMYEALDLSSDVALGFDATVFANATTRMLYASSPAELQTFVAGTEIQTLKSNAIGWFGVTPQTRPTAYTQTYSSTSRTVAAVAFSGTTLSTYTPTSGGYAFSSEEDMQNFFKDVDTIKADLENVKKNLNSVIDDLQGYGLCQ